MKELSAGTLSTVCRRAVRRLARLLLVTGFLVPAPRAAALAPELTIPVELAYASASRSIVRQLKNMGHRRRDARQDPRTGHRLTDAKPTSGAVASGVMLSPAPSGDCACLFALEIMKPRWNRYKVEINAHDATMEEDEAERVGRKGFEDYEVYSVGDFSASSDAEYIAEAIQIHRMSVTWEVVCRKWEE